MRVSRLLLVMIGLGLAASAPLAMCQAPVIKDAERATGYKKPTPEQRRAMYAADRIRNGGRVAMIAKAMAAPATFDCVALGWVPPIEDQGNCGSCYGVATADQLTCTFVKAGYQKNDGSFAIRFQYGLDCQNFGGCNGGWGYEVAEFMRDKGFPAEHYIDAAGKKVTDYPPYEARSRSCRTVAGAKLWKPAAIGLCSGSSNRAATVDEIKASLMQYGVVNIAFNATSAYGNAGVNVVTVRGGANHETTLVGWDDAKKAWKTRGNWGTGLGDKGYVWMSWTSDIEDPFWMTTTPLPPAPPSPEPPEPQPPTPIPPGPIPGGATLTLNKQMGPGTFIFVGPESEIVPAGTLAKFVEMSAKFKELQDLIGKPVPPVPGQTLKDKVKASVAADKAANNGTDADAERLGKIYAGIVNYCDSPLISAVGQGHETVHILAANVLAGGLLPTTRKTCEDHIRAVVVMPDATPLTAEIRGRFKAALAEVAEALK